MSAYGLFDFDLLLELLLPLGVQGLLDDVGLPELLPLCREVDLAEGVTEVVGIGDFKVLPVVDVDDEFAIHLIRLGFFFFNCLLLHVLLQYRVLLIISSILRQEPQL